MTEAEAAGYRPGDHVAYRNHYGQDLEGVVVRTTADGNGRWSLVVKRAEWSNEECIDPADYVSCRVVTGHEETPEMSAEIAADGEPDFDGETW